MSTEQFSGAIAELGRRLDFVKVLQVVGDFSPICNWVKEYQGPGKPFKMVWISKRYEEMWGKTAEEYEGRTDFEVWSEETAIEFMANDHEVFNTEGDLWTVEHPDGEICVVCKRKVVTDDFQGVCGSAFYLHDIPKEVLLDGRD